MTIMIKGEKIKKKILEAIKNANPAYVTYQDIAKATGISRVTVSKYMQILEAEGKIKATKKIITVTLYEAVK